MEVLNPLSLLRKGYGRLEQDGKVITAAKAVKKDRPLTIEMADGTIVTDVKEVTGRGKTVNKLKNFEQDYADLEKLVSSLDDSALTLKESLDIFEKAVKLSKSCEDALDYARQRAAELSDAQDGPVPAAAENNASQAAGDAMEEGILDL